jgi:hypothetical protein
LKFRINFRQFSKQSVKRRFRADRSDPPTVHPTADQETALDDLSAASSRASDIIQSSCPTTVLLTRIGLLGAAEQRLDATNQAIEVVRQPLERFYGR